MANPTGGRASVDRVCRLAGKGCCNQKHYLWPFSSAGGKTRGNSESSVRLRSWSPRTGAGKRGAGRRRGPGGMVRLQSWLETRDPLPQGSLPPQGKELEELEGTGKKGKEKTNVYWVPTLC